MATSSTITDKIQSDILNCKICLNTMEQPKMLPCLHTYCQGCLKKLVRANMIQCPECRVIVDVSAGISSLKTNFHINTLLDILQSQEKEAMGCSLCPQGWKDKNSAVAQCISCPCYLCRACGDSHRISHSTHTVLDLAPTPLDKADAGMILQQRFSCQFHPKEQVCHYCSTCDRLICFQCYSLDCIKHKRLGIAEAAKLKKPTVIKLVERLGTDLQSLAQQEGELNEAMDKVKATELSIISNLESTLTEVINDLFQQGDAIKKTVSECVKKQEELIKAAKSNLELQKEKTKSMKELGVKVIMGSDVKEMVCLESIIQDQIHALQPVNIQELNKSWPRLMVNKSVRSMISETHLFTVTLGDGAVTESELTVPSIGQASHIPETHPPNQPVAQPTQWAVQRYYFDTMLEYNTMPKLTGICCSEDGDIIVADEENAVLKCYWNGGSLNQIISLPDEDDDPCSVAVCDNIIACSAKNRLYYLEMDGSLVKNFLLRGSESAYPIAAYEDEYVAVSEGTLCSVSLYDLNGQVVGRIKPKGYDGIRFLFIAVNSEEEFIVSDCGKKCVVIFTRNGDLVTVCSESFVNGIQRPLNPFSVCVDANDNIYVTEPNRILVFSPMGSFKRQLLSTADGLSKPRVLTIDPDDNLIVVQDSRFFCQAGGFAEFLELEGSRI
ncbi:E3 ubiquitin-protein ligase TRIM56-like [Chiloscyllium plagiosum]|uniref:E3 ubiquitin-protein ligase TRIM56-like n=1 Tax=Chiloscyllium plagiosum TaxID=36176 RepID=UPI001CB83604|nr:E3 ubiquitin-protein ligase TRIM56-like [Chiloscyllium plagiosum]